MKRAFLFLSFITMTILVAAQSAEIDNLKKELSQHAQQDSFRVNRLNALATSIQLTSPEREKYANEALAISNKINYVLGKGNALVLLGSIKFNEGKREESRLRYLQADSIAKKTGDLELQANVWWRMTAIVPDIKEKDMWLQKADSLAKKIDNLELQVAILRQEGVIYLATDPKKGLYYLIQAEEVAQRSGNKILLSSLQNSIGSIYQANFTDYAKAMEYLLAGLGTAEEANDTLNLVNSWLNLGAVYSYMGDQDNALTYLLKAQNANKKLGNTVLESNLQTSIGERYRLMGKYPEAIKAYNKALALTQNETNKYINESNLADVYTRIGDLPLAFQYGFSSLKKSKELNDQSTEGWIYGILSRAYLKKNMADSALCYGELGLSAAKQSGTIEFMRDNTLALSDAYAYKKDFQKAYDNRLLYINYRDSMMNEEVRNKTAVQQYTFDLDKKQSQISSLGSQKKYQRNLLIGALALLTLILAVSVVLLRNNRQKQKANKLLQKQKLEIDEKAQNVELLNDIGRKITSSLSVEKIISTVYDNVNTLMDANIFGIGIYNDTTKTIDFPATYENGAALPFYTNDLNDENRFGAVCFKNGKEIIINNLTDEYKNHIQEVTTPEEGKLPVSIIFLPLSAKGEKLGVITVQSFKENAYSEYQLFMLRNIATYAAIAIENAESYETLNKTFSTLKSAQTQLIQSEKMASLGELTAGIAHEIQNPLNFVNNFSDMNREMIEEMQAELKAGNTEEAIAISNDLKANEEKISHHGKRADAIVKGMLQHSRSSSGTKEPTDINALADEYLRLSYHGLRAKDKAFNSNFKTDLDASIKKINVVPQDIGRVLLNLFNNAFYAVKEKKQHDLNGYEPSVLLSTKSVDHTVVITVKDNANGIPADAISKIFQPFFTTKPTGQGTGLGLSLSYDIVKTHGGEISVKTVEGEGTTFIIELPVA